MAEAKKGINYWRLGVLFVRVFAALTLIYFGYWTWFESGDRVYNKYLHSIRKMFLDKSKPSSEAILGMTFEELNQILI